MFQLGALYHCLGWSVRDEQVISHLQYLLLLNNLNLLNPCILKQPFVHIPNHISPDIHSSQPRTFPSPFLCGSL